MQLVFVRAADDWEGLYIDGTLFTEDHSVRWDYEVFPELVKRNAPIQSFVKYSYEDNDRIRDYIEENGRLPQQLSDIVD